MTSADPRPERRIVRCYFGADPHPINDECQDVMDVVETVAETGPIGPLSDWRASPVDREAESGTERLRGPA